MKVHRGKWWVKDASAIHFIPTITITRLPDLTLLKRSTSTSPNPPKINAPRIEIAVTNPRDAPLTLSLSSTSYTNLTQPQPLIPDLLPSPYLIHAYPPTPTCPEDGFTLKLGGYEDELLREEAEGGVDEESAITTAFQTQLQITSNDEDEDNTHKWCSYISYNTAYVSIPLSIPLIVHDNTTLVNKSVCLPLQLRMKKSSTDSTSISKKGESGNNDDDDDDDIIIYTRILLPLPDV